jgi:hypothetical protein
VHLELGVLLELLYSPLDFVLQLVTALAAFDLDVLVAGQILLVGTKEDFRNLVGAIYGLVNRLLIIAVGTCLTRILGLRDPVITFQF